MKRTERKKQRHVAREQAANDRLATLLHERRWCYWIPDNAFVEGRGFRVSIVIENEAGHYPTGDTPEGGDREPWFWGMTLDEARELAERENLEKLGLTPKDAALIVASSVGATFQPAGARR